VRTRNPAQIGTEARSWRASLTNRHASFSSVLRYGSHAVHFDAGSAGGRHVARPREISDGLARVQSARNRVASRRRAWSFNGCMVKGLWIGGAEMLWLVNKTRGLGFESVSMAEAGGEPARKLSPHAGWRRLPDVRVPTGKRRYLPTRRPE
jgi:hypothetical protein